MNVALLDQVVARVDALPRLPDTVQRLIAVVSDPDSSLREIVDAIRYDQSLTTEVLRLCNSAYYGLARSVESLDDAVCLLGTVRVFQLVMAAHARTLLQQPQSGYGLPAGALWDHSVAVAVAAQLLARRCTVPQAGLLFTAGLLHDIGKVILNEFVSVEYARIAERVAAYEASFSEAEQQVLGFTHAEVGARLAERWCLPAALQHCIRYHHEPAGAPAARELVDMIHLADTVCLLLGVGTGDDGLAYRTDPQVLARCALTQADLESVGAEAIAELRSVQALFGRKQG
ncbi:MAG: HDOD domain-containing protein [Phycisphaerales bacterium]|nr:HDOD domain-containing protein [Phycisphaerales bacterium]